MQKNTRNHYKTGEIMTNFKRKDIKRYMADFETTVFEGQEFTEVWAAALCPVETTDPEEVEVFNCLEHFIARLMQYTKESDIIVYFHNLKFDGSFILDWLLRSGAYIPKWDYGEIPETYHIQNEYSYLISDMGVWYNLCINWFSNTCTFLDSFKLLPMSVKAIGEGFKTAHRKTEIEYEGFRKAGGTITDQELTYIKNDVLVVAEALQMMFSEGHKKQTIGGCCLAEYKSILRHEQCIKWKDYFPNLESVELSDDYGSTNADAYIRKSYRGGWCYVVAGKEDKVFKNGNTFDVNSLYPSMMHSDSGNIYPVGYPTFFKGDLPEEAKQPLKFYFVRLDCTFQIKPGMLPFVQLKNNSYYFGNEMLTTSDLLLDGVYYHYVKDLDGKRKEVRCTVTMSQPEFELFLKHYDSDYKILDGCYFDAQKGIFDLYINKYAKIKKTSKGAKRQLAKLFLNNLYGKMGTNPDSSYKVAYLDECGNVKFKSIAEKEKTPIYIPVASAITAYSRRFTIEAAQANFYGIDKPGFIYADTDSIHADLAPEQMRGMKMDPAAFQCWDHESSWSNGIFHRQKTYIEKVNETYIVKCAGLPDRCKDLFVSSVTGEPFECRNSEEAEFLKTKRKITDFKAGLKVPGKLIAHRIRGGVVLCNDYFTIKD